MDRAVMICNPVPWAAVLEETIPIAQGQPVPAAAVVVVVLKLAAMQPMLVAAVPAVVMPLVAAVAVALETAIAHPELAEPVVSVAHPLVAMTQAVAVAEPITLQEVPEEMQDSLAAVISSARTALVLAELLEQVQPQEKAVALEASTEMPH
jgi:hypothetical protein